MIAMLPLADGDWIGVVVFLVIMVISAISQMAGKKKEAQPRPKPRPRPPVRPAQAGPGRQDPVAGELEDFLRRAAGGGGQQPARRPPPAPPARPPARPPVAKPVVAKPVLAEATDDLEIIESVADHMSHTDGDSRFPSQLTGQPDEADQVSRKFDQRMGQFDSSPEKAAHAAAIAEPETIAGEVVESMPPTAAAGLGAMLASPTSLRQAILLKEILERPEYRWG
jgi:hypothetical protein